MQLYIVETKNSNLFKRPVKMPRLSWEYDPRFLDFILFMRKEGSKKASKKNIFLCLVILVAKCGMRMGKYVIFRNVLKLSKKIWATLWNRCYNSVFVMVMKLLSPLKIEYFKEMICVWEGGDCSGPSCRETNTVKNMFPVFAPPHWPTHTLQTFFFF